MDQSIFSQSAELVTKLRIQSEAEIKLAVGARGKEYSAGVKRARIYASAAMQLEKVAALAPAPKKVVDEPADEFAKTTGDATNAIKKSRR